MDAGDPATIDTCAARSLTVHVGSTLGAAQASSGSVANQSRIDRMPASNVCRARTGSTLLVT